MKKKSLNTKKALALASIFLALILLVFVLLERTVKSPSHNFNATGCQGLKLGSQCIPLEVAETNEERLKGLSNKDSLPSGTGMLFVFDKPDEQCMWMKDMKFSIDIVWLDSDKKILKIENQVAPASYPASFCSENTKYVIELESGAAKAAGFSVGQALVF